MVPGVSQAMAMALAKIDAMRGMADGTPFEGAIVLYRRGDAFADAYQAATSTADIRALLERLANSSADEVGQILARHDFGALAVRVRDRLPQATRRALIAKLEVLAQGTSGALPLIIALAPSRHGVLFSGFRPNENLSHLSNPLVSASLTSALAALPARFAEQARQAMVAGLNASGVTLGGDSGVTSAGAAARRSHELLLARLARKDVQALIDGLETCGTDEVCSRIDAFHSKLFAGVTTGRGNPGFARAIEAARVLQRNLPAMFAGDADGVYIGGSFTNAKWRADESDIDINFDERVSRTVIATTYDSWTGKSNAIADWLRPAEQEIATMLGVTRNEGKLLSLAFACGPEGEPRPWGPSLLGQTGYFAIRVTRNAIFLHVFNPDDPGGPPLYARLL